MSTAYAESGRSNQKRRTRAALVAAARDLLAEGTTPTVEEAAAAASISRTTAYRYFPSQAALLVAAHPEIDAHSLLHGAAATSDDAAVRLDAVVDAFTRIIADSESQQRAMLRLSLEPDPTVQAELPLRQGRAIAWIEEALEPLGPDMTKAQRHRLALAVRSASGIEALVWLTDIAGLSRNEARKLMRWSAQAMLRAALDEG
jgi:AcrR family transcriptional regulator